ncbi:Putative flippase GtrA (transmembrane translocase of bactoprenol-linked glucose) [Pseudoxanthomonas sp. GM95]|uniref:GtrA family protein n=1 Tax=Pseudoxanthomonas sp. GM95 TaxID=1881043 RepID=UPI0008CE7044|nr:GtrA family protein [Pseudoxanthomonas sp. GM95]SEL72095.1 Putative flippase GtrA (transmembrane translocase of bactoprenol-linked glucose) [Pseudoxanthomonas sp. GM95]
MIPDCSATARYGLPMDDSARGYRSRGAQFLRYLFVSAAALALDFGLFWLSLRLLQLPWWIAACIGFMAGALAAYLASIRWVFSTRRLRKHIAQELSGFLAIGLTGLVLTQAILFVGIEELHFKPEYVRLASAMATFAFNYVIRSLLLFTVRKAKA